MLTMWLAFFNLDGMEMIVVLVLAILLFGDNLPQVARSMAKSFLEFKKGLQDLRSKSGIDDEIRNIKREVELSNLPSPRRLIQDAIRDAESEVYAPANGTEGNAGQIEQSRHDAGAPPVDAVPIPPPAPSPFEQAAQAQSAPQSTPTTQPPGGGAAPPSP